MQEVAWQAENHDGGIVDPGAIEGLYVVTNVDLPEGIQSRFLQGVSVLEDVPESKIDYHPGSNKQVIDLVHPSLYCLVYGRTRQVQPSSPSEKWHNFLNTGTIIPPPTNGRLFATAYYSKDFQWLPSEIQVSEDGKSAQFKSYINNLRPQHFKEMYKALEYIFATYMVPLFEKILTDAVNAPRVRIDVDPYMWYTEGSDDFENLRNDSAENSSNVSHPAQSQEGDNQEGKEPVREATSDSGEWQDGDSEDEDSEDDYENRHPKQPVIPRFIPPRPPQHVVNLKGQRLQVIVKMANIILTPENPSYPGGSWHVGALYDR